MKQKHVILRGLQSVQFFNYDYGFYMPFLRLRVREISLVDLIGFVSARVKSAFSKPLNGKKVICRIWFRIPLSNSRFYYFNVDTNSFSSRKAALKH